MSTEPHTPPSDNLPPLKPITDAEREAIFAKLVEGDKAMRLAAPKPKYDGLAHGEKTRRPAYLCDECG